MIAAMVLVGVIAGPFSVTSRAEVPLNGLTEAEQRAGWRLIFDGNSTDGWRNYRQDDISDGWQVKNGALLRVAQSAGDIVTEEQFEFFELSMEYRISKAGNSGVMFHVTEDGQAPWHTGPEVQIQDNVDGHDPQKSGWLYQLYEPVKPDWAIKVENQAAFKGIEVDDATRPADEWNHIYLRVSPWQSEVAVNGVSYYYFEKGSEEWDRRVAKSKFAKFPSFGKPTKGHICLQDHGNDVAFRNIKMRELAADGSVPNPVDGYLDIKAVEAFPNLTWDGWSGVDERGRIRAHRPLELTHANDNSGRIFVATQIGMVHCFKNEPNVKQSHLFLDLRDKTHDWASDNEEGLLGLAFHPEYKNNGQFFVYYSTNAEPRVAHVSRFQVSAADPNRADPDSEEVVMRIEQPFSNHNGGSIAFGNDGYLYIALGDGGGRNDPVAHGQDLKTWMGCVLRIDIDRKEGDRGYAIPADNPFASRSDDAPEIFAYGFRNIWRLAVDRPTGTIWVGDVGQDLWEEVNIVKSGGNYGWSIREGSYAFGNGTKAGPGTPVDPVWEYDHQIGKSITGGHVYRGKRLPELDGAYLYADYVSGKIWALKYDAESGRVVENLGIRSNGVPVFAFGQDADGEVYYMIAAPSGRTIFRFESNDAVAGG
jgi:glucose/arabinose dehydrogenase